MSKLDVDALEALQREATPGPWTHSNRQGNVCVSICSRGESTNRTSPGADAAFIAALANAAPALFAAVRGRDTLLAVLDEARDIADGAGDPILDCVRIVNLIEALA